MSYHWWWTNPINLSTLTSLAGHGNGCKVNAVMSASTLWYKYCIYTISNMSALKVPTKLVVSTRPVTSTYTAVPALNINKRLVDWTRNLNNGWNSRHYTDMTWLDTQYKVFMASSVDIYKSKSQPTLKKKSSPRSSFIEYRVPEISCDWFI